MQLEPSEPIFAAALHFSIRPVNHESSNSKPINSTATLSEDLVKPIYLQQVSNFTFADADMKKFIEMVQGLSLDFRIFRCGGVPMVVWCHYYHEEIVLPSSSGFQILEIKEYHGFSGKKHLSAWKILESLR